ncbi:MAG: M23 family metallopeptidase [Bacteroidales bacterium]|jgi:murein DD-endopeptidase MepM/ murein hydrolase activator NlpD|nr:M23 family metallopeptidase [Bacteroidales bacterium]
MPRTKYKFNPESLSFDKVKLSIKAVFLRFFSYFLGSVLVALVYWFLFAMFIDSPKEKALKREIEQLSIQYDLINREMGNIENVLNDLQKTDDNLYRTIFGAEPVSATLREGGEGGVNRYTNLEGYSNSELVIETAGRLDNIQKKLYLQSKSFDEIIELARKKEDMLKSIPAILPISNNDLTRTASGYGLRIHPIYKITKFHAGMDFTAPAGTDVYATGDGTISVVQSSQRGLGKHIIVDHGFGYTSIYAHLSEFNVRRGQKVRRGDVIGYVGNTGTSVANHLHYEIKINGNNVDPVNYYFEDLTPDEYERMIEIASKTGQSFD